MASVLLVVGNKSALSNDDVAITQRLQGLNHTVTTRNSTESANVSGQGLVVFSRSTEFSIHSDYSSVNVPIMGLSRGAWTMLGWSTSNGQAHGNDNVDNKLSPIGSSHPLHAGLSGLHSVLSINSNWSIPTGYPTSLNMRWQMSGQGAPIIFSFEPGSTLLSGKTAGNRQVGWGFSNSNNISLLNSTGWQIFDAAVNWALGGSTAAPKLATPGSWSFTTNTDYNNPALMGTWSAVSGAINYTYEIQSLSGTTWSAFHTATIGGTSFTRTTNVQSGTQYRARVRANP